MIITSAGVYGGYYARFKGYSYFGMTRHGAIKMALLSATNLAMK